MSNDKELKYRKEYEKQLPEIREQLFAGEVIVHCIDRVSFGGKFYAPEWCITNRGRGYSLSAKKWLIPQAVGTNRAYWAFCGIIQPKIHQLVVNYFKDESDKIAIEFFGEDGVDCHHLVPIDIPEKLKNQTAENEQERIEHCMKCNCKSNVFYQKKEHNKCRDKLITKGLATKEEENGTEIWTEDIKNMRSIMANSGKLQGNSNGARIIYSKDENGNLKEETYMVLNLKGSFFDEDNVIIEDYKVNAGSELKSFVEENKETVLEAIKNDPPKSKHFRKYKVIDGNGIYYALA